jgi:CYTH domain-containing protein
MEGKYYITTKKDVPGSYLTQIEDENEITKEEYDKLLKNQIGNTIFKDRYYIPYGKYTLELNLYKKDLEGLCMLEVEFPSEDEALAFDPPVWIKKEVSNDKSYRNSSLAINGLPDEMKKKRSIHSLNHNKEKNYER